MKNYLNFETDIKELETEIEKLKDPFNQSGVSEVDTQKISKIQSDLDEKLEMIYSNLDPWQTTMVARHEDRPKSKFFIDNLFEDFIPLSGDRHYGEDNAVLTGFAKFEGQSVLVIGQEKGDDLDTRIKRNFGMMRPEGYRKTIRLMELANRFNLTIISSGSEITLACEISHKLATENIYSKVVSMPCQELFDLQSEDYKNKILAETDLVVSIEASETDYWKKYTGTNGLNFGINDFGKSAPYKKIYDHFGLNVDNIIKKVKEKL